MSKKCTMLCCEAHFEVKMQKTSQPRSFFVGSDVENLHDVVLRSTF